MFRLFLAQPRSRRSTAQEQQESLIQTLLQACQKSVANTFYHTDVGDYHSILPAESIKPVTNSKKLNNYLHRLLTNITEHLNTRNLDQDGIKELKNCQEQLTMMAEKLPIRVMTINETRSDTILSTQQTVKRRPQFTGPSDLFAISNMLKELLTSVQPDPTCPKSP